MYIVHNYTKLEDSTARYAPFVIKYSKYKEILCIQEKFMNGTDTMKLYTYKISVSCVHPGS